jgi:NADPH:quinone reductase-like Zn-dependent oxidoreductase
MSQSTYRAIVCEALGPPDRLRLRELPRAPLGLGQVRVAVKAAGINFPDVLTIQGLYQHRPQASLPNWPTTSRTCVSANT